MNSSYLYKLTKAYKSNSKVIARTYEFSYSENRIVEAGLG
jgi:hypothetical protein